jgi:hypothetical protein
MSDARTSPPPQARYAVSAVCDLRGVAKVYGRGPAEVHAPRQPTAPHAGAIVSSLRVCNVTAKAERHWIRRAPTYRKAGESAARMRSAHTGPASGRRSTRMWSPVSLH